MACTFRLTTVAATAAKHLLTAHRSNVRNGVSAGGALVLRRLSDRPFRVRRRPLQGTLLPRVAQRKLHRTHFFFAPVHGCWPRPAHRAPTVCGQLCQRRALISRVRLMKYSRFRKNLFDIGSAFSHSPPRKRAFKSKFKHASLFMEIVGRVFASVSKIDNSLGVRLDVNECVKYLDQWRIAIH